MKATLACVQFKAKLMDKKANLQMMKEWVEKVKKTNPSVDLIVFPELSLTGYECEEGYYEMAEPFPEGESIQEMGKVAAQNNVHIIFGFVEQDKKDGDTILYNTAALIDNRGNVLGKYRKVHLVDGVETKWFAHGEEYNVFDTSFGKVGMMICWDSAFPEVARSLALKGAEIIAVPAAWEEPNGEDWDLVQSARSFDNVLYIAACNRTGQDKELTFFGKSKIVGPLGRTIKGLDEKEGFVCAEVELDELKELREGYYVLLKDRRPATYGTLVAEV